MKKILKVQFVSRDLPVQGGGGTSVYRLSLLRYLKSIGCEIEYVLLHYKGEESVTKNSFSDLFDLIKMPENTEEEYPIWSDVSTKAEREFLNKQAHKINPDLLIVDHPWLGGLITRGLGKSKLVTAVLTHDVQFKKIKDFKKFGVNPYKRNKGFEQPYWDKKLEKKLLSKADIILAIQKEDYKTFRRLLPSTEVVYLPMAVETKRDSITKEVKYRCLFVGGSAQHNVFGLNWFISEVWPLVIKEIPSATLHICGEVYQEMDVKKYKNQPNIVFKGKVKNLDKEYFEASVCIVPLKVGSGLKIKLVEAMSYGKACVSTNVGIQGISEVTNYGVINTDNNVQFANAITDLYKNDKKRVFLGSINKQFIRAYLTPNSAYSPFILSVLQKLKCNL